MHDRMERRRFLAGAGAIGVGATTGCLGVFGGGSSGGSLESLPNNGADKYIDRVKTFESKGTNHVDGEVEYTRIPPTSGPHNPDWVRPGYYTERQRAEMLVHSLEHGYVVIYYDPSAITDSARSDLKARANEYTRQFAGVVVTPALKNEPPAPYTLTAWRHRLRLEKYDPKAVTAFLAQYLGRGPENPVR